MDLGRLIDRVADAKTISLCNQRLKVVSAIKASLNLDAARLRDAIDSELMRRLNAPQNGWSGGRQGEPRYLMTNGVNAAVIYRIETHGVDRGGYRIEIGERVLEEVPRHIEEAKALAESFVIGQPKRQ